MQEYSVCTHIGQQVSHIIKIILDEIFGRGLFLNEIIWQRRLGQSIAKGKIMGVITDSIFVFVKSMEYVFNPQFTIDCSEDYINERYRFKSPEGRIYKLDNLGNPDLRPTLIYEYKGCKPPFKWMAVSLETMKRMDKEGRLEFPKKPAGYSDTRETFDLDNFFFY
jgi:adenine-specific DNA-methyltransferase